MDRGLTPNNLLMNASLNQLNTRQLPKIRPNPIHGWTQPAPISVRRPAVYVMVCLHGAVVAAIVGATGRADDCTV